MMGVFEHRRCAPCSNTPIKNRGYPVVAPKVEYMLSSFGKTLEPVIAAIATWGETYEQEMRSHLEPQNVAPQEKSS
jgi:DNA-binding HxlR family transcriptional regulator